MTYSVRFVVQESVLVVEIDRFLTCATTVAELVLEIFKKLGPNPQVRGVFLLIKEQAWSYVPDYNTDSIDASIEGLVCHAWAMLPRGIGLQIAPPAESWATCLARFQRLGLEDFLAKSFPLAIAHGVESWPKEKGPSSHLSYDVKLILLETRLERCLYIARNYGLPT